MLLPYLILLLLRLLLLNYLLIVMLHYLNQNIHLFLIHFILSSQFLPQYHFLQNFLHLNYQFHYFFYHSNYYPLLPLNLINYFRFPLIQFTTITIIFLIIIIKFIHLEVINLNQLDYALHHN